MKPHVVKGIGGGGGGGGERYYRLLSYRCVNKKHTHTHNTHAPPPKTVTDKNALLFFSRRYTPNITESVRSRQFKLCSLFLDECVIVKKKKQHLWMFKVVYKPR